MRLRSCFLFVLSLVVVLAACQEEKLTRRAPKLDLTVYTRGQAYNGFDDATQSIDLGDVPVYATKWAIFQMSNPTQIPLKIDGVYAAESVGLRWQEAHYLDFETLKEMAKDDPVILDRPFNSPTAGKKFFDCNLDNAMCEVEAPGCGDDKVPALVNGCETTCVSSKECLTEIPAFGVFLLGIAYQPIETGEHNVTVALHSNAANGTLKSVNVKATAIFRGAPDIELSYNRGTYTGPSVDDCTTTSCTIPDVNALSFGNIGLGAPGSHTLLIKNAAQCEPFLGVDPCTLCGLTVDRDPTAYSIGIGFKAGTNDLGLFAFGASTRVPFDILQRNVNLDDNGTPVCADAINPNRPAEGFVALPIVFNAPMTEGEYRTTLIIESSDPDEPVIEIPVTAFARNAPIAIAGLRAFDPLNPSAPYSEASNLQPLKRVYFDGRRSYDPRVCPACALPADPSCQAQRAVDSACAITNWQWQVVEYPVGTDPGMFQHQGADTPLYNFWLPLAGHYVISLTVGNSDGIWSGDTEESRVQFDVIPGSRIHVQLTWDDTSNDQDLHLLKLPETEELCAEPWDCYFANKEPVWFSSDAVATGSNPRLDIDDTNGLGPENINIDDPEPGIYRVAVHYWRGTAPTRNTVRIFLNGLQVAEYRRTVNDQQKWTVADIKWSESGIGSLTPYESDVAGQVGAIDSFTTTECSGW